MEISENPARTQATSYAGAQQLGARHGGELIQVHYQDANNLNYSNFDVPPAHITVTNGMGTWVNFFSYNDYATASHLYRLQVVGNNYQRFENGVPTKARQGEAGSTALGVQAAVYGSANVT